MVCMLTMAAEHNDDGITRFLYENLIIIILFNVIMVEWRGVFCFPRDETYFFNDSFIFIQKKDSIYSF